MLCVGLILAQWLKQVGSLKRVEGACKCRADALAFKLCLLESTLGLRLRRERSELVFVEVHETELC